MRHVCLNGDLVPRDRAMLPVNDRAILFGDAAYETMRSYSGRFFRLPEHLRRLRDTLHAMELELPASDEELTRGAQGLIEHDGIPEARLRLTVTGGSHEGAIRLKRPHPPQWIFTAEPLTTPPPETYRDGVRLAVCPWPVHSDSLLPRIKTVNRLMHLMAKERALAEAAWDALFVDEDNHVLEGTATNLFCVRKGTLRTASTEGPVLAGVTRDAVLEVAQALGVPVNTDPLPLQELEAADEAFLTSTTIELLPVTSIRDQTVGSGTPGEVWRRLREGYRDLVSRETGVPLS